MATQRAIKSIHAREILDSRGNPTVAVRVTLRNGIVGEASVPSGASTGVHEAHELRDNDPKRYGGKGVRKAVRNVNTKIASELNGVDPTAQRAVDEIMLTLDGTENKTKLGANAILGVSLAVAHAAARAKGIPLYRHIRNLFDRKNKTWRMPQPTMNVINGGKHAKSGLQVQEFMIVPFAPSFAKRVQMGAEVFQMLKKLLDKAGYATGVGDEGGFAPGFTSEEQAFSFLMRAITKAGYKPGKQIALATDIAASEFYVNGKYELKKGTLWPAKKMIAKVVSWQKKYPLVSIEDPLHEDDWDSWAQITKALGRKAAIVGDDLFVTNVTRLQNGIDNGVANAILIKVNQIGSLSETLDCITLAKQHGYKVSVSHRSGETGDTTIADLAVAVNADYLKSGSLSRSERVEKYNRVMEIETELKNT